MKNVRVELALTAALALALSVGCAHKKVAKAAPATPPPPPAAPTATLAANPPAVQPGQKVTLSWHTQNANTVTIAGVGTVDASGSWQVTPDASRDYVLTAKGPGGEREASARVTVMPAPAQTASDDDLQKQFARLISDVYFDYDAYNIRADQQAAVQKAADFLNAHRGLRVTIEGHCDQRGSDEYNLALGDNRANALREALVRDGANSAQFKTISYGKEHLFCSENTEQCYAQNRRDHYVPGSETSKGQ